GQAYRDAEERSENPGRREQGGSVGNALRCELPMKEQRRQQYRDKKELGVTRKGVPPRREVMKKSISHGLSSLGSQRAQRINKTVRHKYVFADGTTRQDKRERFQQFEALE